MERYLGLLLIIGLVFFSYNFTQSSAILVESATPSQEILPVTQPVKTQSRFTFKLEGITETILKKTVYINDPETEAGIDKVLEEGEDGKRVKIFKITYFEGEEYDREITSTETTPAKDKKILRGTKIVWKTYSSSDGEVRYWKKMRVYATHYDSHCLGCNEWTATGMRAGYGVIAVDPKVIPLGSRVYVPGYGFAIAGDTGGAIKGNIIDLGFDDAKTAGWTARFVDIYLL